MYFEVLTHKVGIVATEFEYTDIDQNSAGEYVYEIRFVCGIRWN